MLDNCQGDGLGARDYEMVTLMCGLKPDDKKRLLQSQAAPLERTRRVRNEPVVAGRWLRWRRKMRAATSQTGERSRHRTVPAWLGRLCAGGRLGEVR